MIPKPVTLIILDGWGVASSSRGNTIALARTPNFNQYLQKYPYFTLQAAGEAVGLSWGEVGNSEVGHLNLGAGKIIYQNLPRITQAIWNKTFFSNPALLGAIEHAKKYNSKLHFLGLVSNGGVHSFNEHLYALLELAKENKIKKVFVHAILDGRDTPYNSGYNFINQLEEVMASSKIGQIATLSGRFYAMDRDHHWERTEKAYRAMVLGEGQRIPPKGGSYIRPSEFIQECYKKKIYDEEILPTAFIENNPRQSALLSASIRETSHKSTQTQNTDKHRKNHSADQGLIEDDDAVIFFNFRADRARQLTKAFVLPGFEKFSRPRLLQNLFFTTFTEYEKDLPVKIAFSPEKIDFPLARILSEKKLNQLHIAETEKYAHATYFFNGGKEESFEGEDDILVPSPRVASYAQTPEMSAQKIAKKVIREIANGKYDFILINFANPDMVGHTGDLEASKKAIETVDKYLGKIVEAVLFKDGVVLITADHGNAEELINLQTGEIDKEHSTNPVPFIAISKQWLKKELEKEVPDLSLLTPVGVLADVAPTVLKVMAIEPPVEMTGRSLV